MNEGDWRDPMIPSKIELPLDIAVSDLKRYKKDLPFNLYSMTSSQVNKLKINTTELFLVYF